MKRFILLLIVVALAITPAASFSATYAIDPDHSSIQFKVRHLMVSNVKGVFGKVSGTIDLNEQDITKSRTSVSIETSSIDTGVTKRDEHLRSADFFDVAKYPQMTFSTRKVHRTGANTLAITGDLTIHGITREVVLDVEGPTAEVKDPWGNFRRGASATTRINRKDFGLTWNKALETGGVVVGDEVTINLEIEMIKK